MNRKHFIRVLIANAFLLIVLGLFNFFFHDNTLVFDRGFNVILAIVMLGVIIDCLIFYLYRNKAEAKNIVTIVAQTVKSIQGVSIVYYFGSGGDPELQLHKIIFLVILLCGFVLLDLDRMNMLKRKKND